MTNKLSSILKMNGWGFNPGVCTQPCAFSSKPSVIRDTSRLILEVEYKKAREAWQTTVRFCTRQKSSHLPKAQLYSCLHKIAAVSTESPASPSPETATAMNVFSVIPKESRRLGYTRYLVPHSVIPGPHWLSRNPFCSTFVFVWALLGHNYLIKWGDFS